MFEWDLIAHSVTQILYIGIHIWEKMSITKLISNAGHVSYYSYQQYQPYLHLSDVCRRCKQCGHVTCLVAKVTRAASDTGAMMTSSNGNLFRVTGPLCEEFTGPGEFPSQTPVIRSFDVFFDLRPSKRWVNNPEAGDLRRHRAHYDVNVMRNVNVSASSFPTGSESGGLKAADRKANKMLTWRFSSMKKF